MIEMYAQQPDSIDKNATLEGSENRVRVAIRRYDEAVKEYNNISIQIKGKTGELPSRLPLSAEIDKW